jgi:hypothetical protein
MELRDLRSRSRLVATDSSALIHFSAAEGGRRVLDG